MSILSRNSQKNGVNEMHTCNSVKYKNVYNKKENLPPTRFKQIGYFYVQTFWIIFSHFSKKKPEKEIN